MRDAWWQVISRARWFGGKGLEAGVSAITPGPWYTPVGVLPAVRSEIAEIAYADGRSELYHLLVGYREPGTGSSAVVSRSTVGEREVEVVDAPTDPDCMRALLEALTSSDQAMEWSDRAAVDAQAPTKVWAGEQSNTTVCLGDDRLFKIFRKVDVGRNLDVEVLAALNGSGITPWVYGTLTGELPSGGRADLGMFVERVSGVTDGWEWACEACAENRSIAVEAAELGRSLREVHLRLAQAFGTGNIAGEELSATMLRRLQSAAAQVVELREVEDSLKLSFGALAGLHLTSQRVHGDFHLGQTLRSADGWTIIDFEGEPLKTLAERRELDSVWRDVAGMLRSFDYVRGAHPDPTSQQALAWCAEARQGFLNGYGEGLTLDPNLLAAYETDKAIYEVVYEVRNRPDWVHIPLRAVHDEARRVAMHPARPTR
ncbi:MAG: phosphotransferase [Micropruina sp.]|nr:phosphotransferase [Micropruina sp.]